MLGGTKNSPKLEMSKSESALMEWSLTHPKCKKTVRKSIPIILEGKGIWVR